jgi:hypothetical protein
VWKGPFVTTTRPSAHAFRMHARHAARNLQHGRGMCRAQAWDGVSQAANSVCSPPPCGEWTRRIGRFVPGGDLCTANSPIIQSPRRRARRGAGHWEDVYRR